MNRRELIAGGAALPFAGAAGAVASSADVTKQAAPVADDPAVRAFNVWMAAREEARPFHDRREHVLPCTEEEVIAVAELEPFKAAEDEALEGLARTTATTAEGALCQMRGLVWMLGSCGWGGNDVDAEDVEFGYYGSDDIDGEMARSLNRSLHRLTAAERLA